jgi:hypothetical protein
MPVVRISDKTWERLKVWATPLEDTPDSTIRKLLDQVEPNGASDTQRPPAPQPGAKRLPRGKKTSEQAFERPLLEALHELGGAGVMYQVLPVVEEKLRHVLKDVDYERLETTGVVRWRSTAQWTRHRLAERGLIMRGPARGIWELTDHGARTVGQWIEESAL